MILFSFRCKITNAYTYGVSNLFPTNEGKAYILFEHSSQCFISCGLKSSLWDFSRVFREKLWREFMQRDKQLPRCDRSIVEINRQDFSDACGAEQSAKVQLKGGFHQVFFRALAVQTVRWSRLLCHNLRVVIQQKTLHNRVLCRVSSAALLRNVAEHLR